MAWDTKILCHRFSLKISLTNAILVDDAVALTVQLIFLRQPFIAGGQALGVVLRLAVLDIEL